MNRYPSKNNFNNVLNELKLLYNSGLWWLYVVPAVEVFDSEYNYIETRARVSFTDFDDSIMICEQDIKYKEVLNELKEKMQRGCQCWKCDARRRSRRPRHQDEFM